MDFTLGDFAASACAITLGAILQASTGLGAGLVVVPLLSLISLALVPGPVIFASLVLSFLMAYRGRDRINFMNMRTLMLGVIAGMALGTLSIVAIPFDRVGILFGLLVLVAVGITAAGPPIRLTRLNVIFAGALSGFMGATAAIGAPVLALLYQHEEGRTLRATLGFLYFVSSILMLSFLWAADHFGMQEVRLGLYLVPGFVAGYVLAAPVARVLDRGYSRAAVLLIATISAVVLVVKSSW